MSNLSQFFKSQEVGFTKAIDRGTSSGSVMKVFTSSAPYTLPAATCYVGYGVIGAGGRACRFGGNFSPTSPCGFQNSGAGGGFSWKEEASFSQPGAVTANVVIGSSTVACNTVTGADICSCFDACNPIPAPVVACPCNNPFIFGPSHCVIFARAGYSCIGGTGLTEICATGGTTVLQCFNVPGINGQPTQTKLAFSASTGGCGIGGDVNTQGAGHSTIGQCGYNSGPCIAHAYYPLGNFCSDLNLNPGNVSFVGGGAGNLLGPGICNSNGFGFGGAASPGFYGHGQMHGLLGTSACYKSLFTGATVGQNKFCANPGESGYITQHTFDRCHFSIAKTLMTASGGAGIRSCTNGSYGTKGYCGGTGGAFNNGQCSNYTTGAGFQSQILSESLESVGTGSATFIGVQPYTPCFNGSFGGGGHAYFCNNPTCTSGAVSSGGPGIAVIEYWTE